MNIKISRSITDAQWHKINTTYKPLVTKNLRMENGDRIRYWQGLENNQVIFEVTEIMFFTAGYYAWFFEGENWPLQSILTHSRHNSGAIPMESGHVIFCLPSGESDCLHCGDRYKFKLPMPLPDMVKCIDAFVLLHADCVIQEDYENTKP
ncbi:MAG: hypothetical protein QX196_06290 [Methylococcaceae bacterium]